MKVDRLDSIRVNGSTQWILVRGEDLQSPLILHVQAGPGLPIIPEAGAMKRLFNFEDNYLVAYWDQRACGKSFSNQIDASSINFSQLADDIISCIGYLLNRYGKKKAIVVGYSVGATLSLMAAARRPGIFDRLFLVGMDIDVPTANQYAMEFAISKAKERNDKRLLRQARMLSKTEITDASQFQRRAKVLGDLEGIRIGTTYNRLLLSSMSNMLLSKAYRLSDIPKTIRGMEYCQNALLPELNTLDLFNKIKGVEVPLHFVQGRHDGVAPCETAVKYYDYIQSPLKTFDCFEKSAHMAHYDEPKKFAILLRETTQPPHVCKDYA